MTQNEADQLLRESHPVATGDAAVPGISVSV